MAKLPRWTGRLCNIRLSSVADNLKGNRNEGTLQLVEISVALLLESLAVGLSVTEIVGAYPSLTGKAVRGALAGLSKQADLQPA